VTTKRAANESAATKRAASKRAANKSAARDSAAIHSVARNSAATNSSSTKLAANRSTAHGAAKKSPARKRVPSKSAPTTPSTTALDEPALLAELLGRKPETAFSAYKLSGKAHFRWNRDQLVEAAVLFDAAARRATAEATPGRDQTMVYRSRAAVCFARAGKIERAWPLLEETSVHDWRASGTEADSNFSEWAFVEMLAVHAERGDRAAFAALFARAVARGDELGERFPFIHPKQDLLLQLCEQLGLTAEAQVVAERIRER
jgi:hypothetical protein